MDKPQFHIKQAKISDEKRVEEIFALAAAKFGLRDTKVTSLVAHTICNYSEGVGFGFGLASRRHDDLILVDFNPLKGRTEKFTAVFDFIVGELRASFGERMSQADEQLYITARNTLPISDEARVFNRKIIDPVLQEEPPPDL